ncbi:Gluconokinase [Propionibacterium freudenreichii]|nr:Gluconokinase [Propionibacterium freudenreichii]
MGPVWRAFAPGAFGLVVAAIVLVTKPAPREGLVVREWAREWGRPRRMPSKEVTMTETMMPGNQTTEIPEARPVPFARAIGPFVLAMDIGSTSTRAALYDAMARPVLEQNAVAEHHFVEGADGTSEIDADQMADEVAETITGALAGLEPGTVSAVAMDTFAASLICVDAQGRAISPCMTYADSRSAPQLAELRKVLDLNEAQQAVGVRLHTSYHPPRLLWIKQNHPDFWARTARFVSLGEYVFTKLAGVDACATSTMAWAGMLNRHSGQLDDYLLSVTDTRADQYAQIVDPDQPQTPDPGLINDRWPALSGAKWFPTIPDGYASNIGVGAVGAETVALSAATSGAMRVIVPGTPEKLPSGLWAYRVSRHESIVGGALNDVGRVMTWLTTTFAPVDATERDTALRAAPRPDTPLVLPFLTGERATGWSGNARAVFCGVTAASGPWDMWRGTVEGVAISYRRIFEQLRSIDVNIERILASGGVTHHFPATLDVITNALGYPVHVVNMERMTMRGTAMMALGVINPEGKFATAPQHSVNNPDPSQAPYYDDLRKRFEEVYDEVIAGKE